MNRRTFVVLLGAVAGCNAASSSDPSNGTQTAARTSTQTATSTPRPTETGTPTSTAPTETEQPPPTETETETATPTDAERRAARQIEQAKTRLTDVVETFTGDYGSELTDVTASSTDFLDASYELQTQLADAQQAYTEAEDAAASTEQTETAERLQGCWHFLDDARDTQMEVVDAYSHLANARDAFDDNDPETGRTAAEQVQTVRRRAANRYQTLQAESTATDAAVLDAISESEYQRKLAQFEADIGVYEDLEDTLDEFAEGIKWYKLAIIEFQEDDRNVQDAEDKADNARDILSDVSNALTAIIKDLGDDTTLRPMLKSLRSIASEKARNAARMDN
jgi:hypothetical protein